MTSREKDFVSGQQVLKCQSEDIWTDGNRSLVVPLTQIVIIFCLMRQFWSRQMFFFCVYILPYLDKCYGKISCLCSAYFPHPSNRVFKCSRGRMKPIGRAVLTVMLALIKAVLWGSHPTILGNKNTTLTLSESWCSWETGYCCNVFNHYSPYVWTSSSYRHYVWTSSRYCS